MAKEHPLRFGIQLQPRGTDWSSFLQTLRLIEQLGYDTVWNFDHLFSPTGDPMQSCFETLTTLGAMAAATERIEFGSLVNGVLYRDPATLAKATAQLDQISNGRHWFSLGAAWAEQEFRAYGLPFPPVKERMERLEEALDLVIQLWRQDRTTFNGTYYQLEDATCEPKPIREDMPIMVGGSGKRTIKISARYATAWNGIGTPEKIAECVDLLQSECAALGRDASEIEISIHPPQLAIARTHEEAERRAAQVAAGIGANLDTVRATWFIGTPEEVRAQLESYRPYGVTHWIMGMGAPYDLEGLRLFAEEVIPAYR